MTEIFACFQNVRYKLQIGDDIIYNRLAKDGSERGGSQDEQNDPDPHPSIIKLDQAFAKQFWGPVIPKQGTIRWGGVTPGKLNLLYNAIDSRLARVQT